MGLAPDHLRREALNAPLHIALLTGGNDKHYAVALASALRSRGVLVDFIGSTDLDCEELHEPGIRFLDLRGEQNEDASWSRKVRRILAYYFRLIAYAASAKPQVFHILWNNKFDLFDRTLLMAYYRLLGKRVAFTAHNVNAAQRDSRDGWLNRLSLRIQYTLCDCIFVHTARMKQELVESFGIQPDVVEVIPYGINVTIPTSGLTAHEAREQLGLADADRVLLFFGQIAPYKGLDLLLDALRTLAPVDGRLRLV
ncbi:MAG: glycosyltransferase, partial [Vicinamibacterales bacterium]